MKVCAYYWQCCLNNSKIIGQFLQVKQIISQFALKELWKLLFNLSLIEVNWNTV